MRFCFRGILLVSSIIYYSCGTKGYEVEEVRQEVPDTHWTRTYYGSDTTRLVSESEAKKVPYDRLATSKGPFTIQAGAFFSESNAVKLADELKSKVNYEVGYHLSDSFYKVTVGNFTLLPDASSALQKVIEAGFKDAFIMEK